MRIIECWLLLLGLLSFQQHAGGAKENLAQRGTATHLATQNFQPAGRAIDGGKDFSTSSTSCATTSTSTRPWWRLDLQAVYRVNTVVVTYREDSFPGSKKDIEVKFGNSQQNDGTSNPSCAVISTDLEVSSITYSCADREGRYLNIVYDYWFIYLSVCEVEVYETDSFRRSYMKIVFNSIANPNDPTVKDILLEELKSALAVRGITNVTLSWSQTPEKLVIHNQQENNAC